MKRSGRIVNVSSLASSLKDYSDELKQRFRNPELSLMELENLISEYEVSWINSFTP